MPSPAEIARIKVEIAKLKSALDDSTDTHIQEIIRLRINELRRALAQLQASRRGPQ
jgi:predicted negative regulator of RcsB-dependent stress response